MKNKLLIGLVSLSLVVGSAYYLTHMQVERMYSPRTFLNQKQQKWNAALEYQMGIRANKVTGKIDPKHVLAAREDVKIKSASRSTIGLEWEEVGPNNIGGRTRAILVDHENSNRVYAGGAGGGLYVSDDAARHWRPVNDNAENLAISCIAQSSNGNIYFGTGSSFEGYSGDGSSGQLGSGMFKSSDGGESFVRLTSTIPVASNTLGVDWEAINAIAIDPNSPNEIYAATSKGLQRSLDGGSTWEHALVTTLGTPLRDEIQDVLVTETGIVICSYKGKIYHSIDGSPGSFILTNGIALNLTGGRTRIKLAMSPEDNNYVYAFGVVNGHFEGLYRSTDMGENWALIQGPVDGYFDETSGLFGNDMPGQGYYDLAICVKPDDRDIVYLGGVQMWKYDGTLTRISNEFGGGEHHVHSDKHTLVFDPKNPDRLYIGSDGGVDISVNAGETFWNADRGYNVTQFYSVAFDSDGKMMGGTQDNGTLEIDFIPSGPTQTGREAEQVNGGDGFDTEYSNLTDIRFSSIYNLQFSRGVDGSGFSNICVGDGEAGPSCGSQAHFRLFYATMKLWESKNDLTSKDSIVFENVNTPQAGNKGDGSTKLFKGKIKLAQGSAKIIPGTVTIYYGTVNTSAYKAVTDAAMDESLSGDGFGSIDYTTADFSVTFNEAPTSAQVVWVTYQTEYPASSKLILTSRSGSLPVEYITPVNINPGDVIKVQDPVQSLLAVHDVDGIWITRDGLRMGEKDTLKWSYLPLPASGIAHTIEFSSDGNHMFVGTWGGRVHRFSGLNDFYSSADIGNVSIQQIESFPLQTVTGIAVDPRDPENVLVTLGNYGQSDYVYLSTNAISGGTNTSFTSVQGDLPLMPVYDAVFSVHFPGTCVIATEFGVYATDKIFDGLGGMNWSDESGGLANVQVFALRQQTHDYSVTSRWGELYLGTHGRGLWRSSSLQTSAPEIVDNFNTEEFVSDLIVYPNPMSSVGTVNFNLNTKEEVHVSIYDIQGRVVKSFESSEFNEGENRLQFNSDELVSGSYFVSFQTKGDRKVAKFIVM